MTELPELPIVNTIQTGSQPIQYLNIKEDNKRSENNMDEFNNDMIIEPDFLFDLENNINDITNTFQNKLENNNPIITPNIDSTPTDYIPPQYKKKYNIINLFSFKYEGDKTVIDDPNLVEFVSVAFNQDFGNLKVSFYQIPDEAEYNNVVFSQSLKLLVSGTIYPSSAFRAVSTTKSFNCLEQLITKTNQPWEKERPIVAIQNLGKDGYYMWITDVVKNIQYQYHFNEWQGNAIGHCFKYSFTNGFNKVI